MQEKVNCERLTYSIPEAAAVLGISTSKMYQVIKIEGFPVLLIGKRRLISKEGLKRWLDKQINT